MATKKQKDPNSLGSAKVVKIPQSNTATKEAIWKPIDWNKVKTISDVKAILENMGLGCSTDAQAYETLKKYLND